MIQKLIGSFRARFQVRLCVFLLLFYHLSLDFNFDTLIRLIVRSFIKFSLFAIDFSLLILLLDFFVDINPN